jgi:hypothetical protein
VADLSVNRWRGRHEPSVLRHSHRKERALEWRSLLMWRETKPHQSLAEIPAAGCRWSGGMIASSGKGSIAAGQETVPTLARAMRSLLSTLHTNS